MVDERVKSEKCLCEVCSIQDYEQKLLDRQIPNLPLTKEQVQRFKQIILDKKGIDLTDEEAFNQATRWLKLSKLVMVYDIEDPIENRLGEVHNVK